MPTPAPRALDKALTLLNLIVADRGARSVSALAADAGLPPATAHRMVAAFARRGFLTSAARGRYLAGPALIGLQQHADLNAVLAATGRPLLAALAKETRLTAHLGVLETDMVTYLVKAGRRGDLFTREGMQLEAYCSGIGKALLALLPETARERYLAGGPFIALTPNTITDAALLREELARIAALGHARDDAEVHAQLYCIAAPVRDSAGAAVAAISLSAWGENGACADPSPHLPALQATARTLEQRLYPQRASA